MSYDENGFQVRPGRGRKRGGARSVRGHHITLVGRIQAVARRNGRSAYRLSGSGHASGRFNARGRGASVAAGLKGRSSWSNAGGLRSRSRRVAVKARVVKLNPQRGGSRGRMFATPKAVASHLDYLQRDGVTRDGARGQLFSGKQDVADGAAFLERGGNDRHQFRFIVSPEDGAELSSLKETTRDLMRQMEADLKTQLDWVAVNHYNTEHPHTHVLLRGVTDDGKTLNISGDYIAQGVRERSSEIVTMELGRQTEHDISRQLNNEIDADRFTQLDRMLIAKQRQNSEFADLRPDNDMAEMFRINRAAMIGRARKLERMGLATEGETGKWFISPDAEPILRERGERGDIIKGIHKTLAREGLDDARHNAYPIVHTEDINERIVGRVLTKDLAGDELGDQMRLMVDGVDGHI
ncbi:MAG: relaxase/mobilization nuclease domain-containing protein, partial [Alphaproteobacteria bacterium]|nr:relaxase/mobilization nuclease domain-containing protein [Alphaproteobacteria bacterium]